MHLIKANVPSARIEAVTTGLLELGVTRLRTAEIRGYVEGREIEVVWRGAHSFFKMVPEYELEALVCDECVDNAVNLIMKIVGVGSAADGFVCVTPVEECYRIRTGHPQL
jgi:nitrogen regulatory protein P-II 1